MKRLMLLLLMLTLASSALAESDVRDVSGVVAQNGRLSGDVLGQNEQSGRQELALRVDCAEPATFSEEQLVLLTTEWVAPTDAQIGSAVRETGAAWSDSALERFTPYSFAGTADARSSSIGADEARANAVRTAQAFVRACGMGETVVASALRPEEEAEAQSINEAVEAREAFVKRTLKEWYTSRLDYTWVQLQYTLRGLPAVGEWRRIDEQNEVYVSSSAANLYVGDAGEMREFCLFYAPREISATPYTGELRPWQDALAELAQRFGCQTPAPTTDERGRTIPAHCFTVTGISPCFQTDDGSLYYPAWLFDVAWTEEGGLCCKAFSAAIDARAKR